MPIFASSTAAALPAVLMAAVALAGLSGAASTRALWRLFFVLAGAAFAAACVAIATAAWASAAPVVLAPWLAASPTGLACALLVQLLGTVIGGFAARYLDGEPGQRAFVAALGGALAAVHALLLADHWAVLIGAWTLASAALRRLLCFYPDRPFALLAAHKKRVADLGADALLAAAAALSWRATGSLAFPDLWAHLARAGATPALQAAAACLALAVVLRTALLPLHGWLIQVMEAPTPVSALLHAGVVNLGGYVLIRFAPLLGHAAPARALLFMFGLGSALLAGLVMLTRVTIKVRLAWSTVAQMGFMVLECALGLYEFAALHLVGHSLYKAHAFLGASTAVRRTRLDALRGPATPTATSVLAAPVLAVALVFLVQPRAGAWPWWWTVVLGLAWAPLLWVCAARPGARLLSGAAAVAGLALAARLLHHVPLAPADAPDALLGTGAAAGMAGLYAVLGTLQLRPGWLEPWRRWSYAGFYVDEIATRMALRAWPARWSPAPRPRAESTILAPAAAGLPR